MPSLIILIFIIGYLAIVFEHPLKLDKTVPALIMGVLCWTVLSIGVYNGSINIIDSHGSFISSLGVSHESLEETLTSALLHHLGKIAEILIFLIGAMTIVELIDLHRGFDIIKKYIRTKDKTKLLWITGIIAFILSAIIDNLTTTIVMITLLRKMIHNKHERLWYISLIITAANAGGAWSPIGDVTTTILWIGKKVSTIGLIGWLLLPSIACFVIPYIFASFKSIFRGNIVLADTNDHESVKLLSSKAMLFAGLGFILLVPIFKTITHLPPYMGMTIALGFMWLISEYIHPEENFDGERKNLYSVHKALSRIELSSILFFLGILLAVTALETLAIGELSTLKLLSTKIENLIPNKDYVAIILGFVSAVIDNVPLVAASMSMFTDAMDAKVWHFIAYSAGTGGSLLVVGSAAGVAAMGMEKIDFIWYLKNISWMVLLGYIAGAVVFMIEHMMVG
jgi:Na+/H+ antiporter NhaD/arsenite permease-like protein